MEVEFVVLVSGGEGGVGVSAKGGGRSGGEEGKSGWGFKVKCVGG